MSEDRLVAVLEEARRRGFLGPGPVEDHIDHAQGFLACLAGVTGRVVDLGSGGGAPALVIALARPDLDLVLVEASAKRSRFLEEAASSLDLSGVVVVEERAEVVGRGPLRGEADAVVARSFGAPAVTAECAAPLLRVGGRLVVSEPPEADDSRWSRPGLSLLGLHVDHRTASPPVMQVLLQAEPCPDRFPRRNGVPAKSPLF